MDEHLLRVFQFQIAAQCDFALRAADDLAVALESKDTRRTFYAIQNLLNAANNIAKALWGQSGRLATERAPLRASLEMDKLSPTLPLAMIGMRNNFEHYDERIDRWWRESKHHNYVDLNVGRPGIFPTPADIDIFRNFDPASGSLTFWGDSFHLPTLITEIATLRGIAESESAKPLT